MAGERFSGNKQLIAAVVGIAALLAFAVMALLALLGVGWGLSIPCGPEERETCQPSTSTRIEAIGSIPLAIAAVGAMLAAGVDLLVAAFRFSAERWWQGWRFLRISGAATALWFTWFLIYPEEPAESELQASIPDCAATMAAPQPGAVLLNRVVLVGYGTPERALGRELPSAPQGDGRFAKNGIQVMASGPVTLEVPPQAEDVTIDWGFSAPRPLKRVTLVPEGAGECGEYSWVVYPGGFHYERPHCLPLRLEVDGSEMVVPVGLGMDCVGVRTG